MKDSSPKPSKEELLKVIKDKHDKLEREDKARRNPTPERLAVKAGPSSKGQEHKTAEEIAEQIMGAGQFGGSLEACAQLIKSYAEEYRSLSLPAVEQKPLEQVEQDLSPVDEAIKYFEDVKTKAVMLHELVFFDGVLSVLDGIKAKRLTRRSSTVESKSEGEKLAHSFSAWCWGKVIPIDIMEMEKFFLRFLKETKRI